MTEHRINIMDLEHPAAAENKATPEREQEPKVVYASVTERFVALLIDYGLIFIPGQIISRVVLKMWGEEFELWHFFALIGGINLIFILYETIFSCADRVTLGKSLVGIAVMKQDLSGPVSFPRALFRTVGYYISGALLFCGFLLAFFDDRHRALHDFLGGSVVVQIRQKAGWERMAIRFLGGLLLVTFAWTAYQQYFGGGKLMEQYYIRHARLHLRKIALLEESHFVRYGYYTNDLLRLSLLSGDPVQFQRDTQAILEPKGFKIGINGDRYKISAVAKNKAHTRVVYEPEE